MAVSYRGSNTQLGAAPPTLSWTVVRGDTSVFKVYVTDGSNVPINLDDWTISAPIDTQSSGLLFCETSVSTEEEGTFFVHLSHLQSQILTTGDKFDISLKQSDNLDNLVTVWTLGIGTITVIEDVEDEVV